MMNHKTLYDKALFVGLRMANKYIDKGDYYPTEAWGCEGQIYPALTGTALLGLYKKSNEKIYLDGVKCIIKSIISKQFPSGGWPLSLGLTGNGMRFEVSDHLIKLTSESEDLPPTVTSLRLIADYKILTGDNSFDDSLVLGFKFIQQFWDENTKKFKEMLTGEALKLRASPSDYNIYTFLCLDSLKKIFPEAEKFVEPVYNSVKKNFESMNSDTYPLLYGMHASLISKIEGPSNYVKTIVKSRINGELGFESRFKIKNHPGAIGHRDGLRGVCIDEGHLRNSIGIAIAMSFYDHYSESKTFTKSRFYKDLQTWIDSMYFESKYYEFLDINSGKKSGFGSSGQYLPIYLALNFF
jgi:hypothetical protein